MEIEEFQLKSRVFYIYPDYETSSGAQNYDVCLIQTPADKYGFVIDISDRFESIPCLPDQIDLKKVFNRKFIIFLFHFIQETWIEMLGSWLG